MQEVSEIGSLGRGAKLEEGEGIESKPLVRSPALVALITKEFKAIERIEEDIAERRLDIKAAIKRLVGKGLSRRGIQAALARRKLVVKGGLDQMDDTLALICGIPALGIQMELFEGNGAAPNGEDTA